MGDGLGHPESLPYLSPTPRGILRRKMRAAPPPSARRADKTLEQNEGNTTFLSQRLLFSYVTRSLEQGAVSLGPWWPWVQPPLWMTFFGLMFPQIRSPGTAASRAHPAQRASASVRGAVCPQRDVGNFDSGDGRALVFSCPALSTLQVLTGAYRGTCAQGHTPGSWQMQEGRMGCPQVLGVSPGAQGVGGSIARPFPHLSSLREAPGLGPSPVPSRCRVYSNFSLSLSLLVCKLGVVMAPASDLGEAGSELRWCIQVCCRC